MNQRREILADTLARLEAERYAPRASWQLPERRTPPGDPKVRQEAARLLPDDLTPEEQAFNRRMLEAALSDDELSRRRAS